MTSLERTLAVIRCAVPDRVPTDLHNFLMAARMAGIPLPECMRSGKLMAESHLAAWHRFRHDVVLVENGTAGMAEAMGCEVLYPSDVAPRVVGPVVRTWADVAKLRVPDPERVFPLNEVLEAVRILRREIGDRVFIMGRADQAPLALAAALRGYEDFLTDLAAPEDPAALERLLDVCLQTTTRYALALQKAGAHGTSLGEFGSDLISPTMYRRYSAPRLKKFYAAMNAAGFPATLHQCGNTAAVLPDMVSSGAAVLELDVHTSPRAVKEATRGKAAVLGMVDPAAVLHRGTPALAEEMSRRALEVLAPGGGFILGPGCALVPETPEENVEAMLACAARHGRYARDGSLT
ncbi:MAG: uroporphyrinogen decarboxylase family protein [Planctomycetes bacterium]|nr:uroporphyrinogen decarboxylase family protein [Planctomycetota bacterium]